MKLSDRRTVERIKDLLRSLGYEPLRWSRVVAYRECTKKLNELEPDSLDVLEISAGHYWQKLSFRNFTEMNFPEFDICETALDKRFDVIIADNVFEHLKWPYRAGKNVLSMLRPGGLFLIITPFLVRYHPVPIDCTRWTEEGLKYFLMECGFLERDIETASWGNRRCINANFKRWRRRGWFGSLKNEPYFPVTVWAFAKAPPT